MKFSSLLLFCTLVLLYSCENRSVKTSFVKISDNRYFKYSILGNDTISIQEVIKNGNQYILDGRSITFFKGKDTLERSDYRNGLLNGRKTTFYPGGKLHSYLYYTNGVPDGHYRSFYSNGKSLERVGDYFDGRLVAQEIFFSSNGNVETFVNRNLHGDTVLVVYYRDNKITSIEGCPVFIHEKHRTVHIGDSLFIINEIVPFLNAKQKISITLKDLSQHDIFRQSHNLDSLDKDNFYTVPFSYLCSKQGKYIYAVNHILQCACQFNGRQDYLQDTITVIP